MESVDGPALPGTKSATYNMLQCPITQSMPLNTSITGRSGLDGPDVDLGLLELLSC